MAHRNTTRRDRSISTTRPNPPKASGALHRRHASIATAHSIPIHENSPAEELHGDPEAMPLAAIATPRPGPVTWLSLPRKRQLAILFLSRLFDFLQIASLQAYMFYQLKSFDPGLSDAAISGQAGLLQGCYTAAQVATAIFWGKVADARWGGRKMVLLIGLGSAAFSCVGFGFSRTFAQAAAFRIIGGGLNGTVGIM